MPTLDHRFGWRFKHYFPERFIFIYLLLFRMQSLLRLPGSVCRCYSPLFSISLAYIVFNCYSLLKQSKSVLSPASSSIIWMIRFIHNSLLMVCLISLVSARNSSNRWHLSVFRLLPSYKIWESSKVFLKPKKIHNDFSGRRGKRAYRGPESNLSSCFALSYAAFRRVMSTFGPHLDNNNNLARKKIAESV